MQPNNELDEQEIQMLFNEIPHAFPPLNRRQNHQNHHQIPVLLTDDSFHELYDQDFYHGYREIKNHQESVSPVSRFSLQSEGSSSSLVSYCGGFSMEGSRRGSSSPPLLEEMKSQTPRKTQNQNGFQKNGVFPALEESLSGELGLSNAFQNMCIRDESLGKLDRTASFGYERMGCPIDPKLFDENLTVNSSPDLGSPVDPCWVRFKDHSQIGNHHWSQFLSAERNQTTGNVVTKTPHGYEGYTNDLVDFSGDFRGLKCPISQNPPNFQKERSSSVLNLQQQYQMAALSGSCFSSPSNNRWQQTDLMNSTWLHGEESLNKGNNEQFLKLQTAQTLTNMQLRADAALANRREVWLPGMLPSMHRSSIADPFFLSQQHGIDANNSDWAVSNSLNLSPLTHSEPGLSFGNRPHCNSLLFNGGGDTSPVSKTNLQAIPNGCVPQLPLLSIRNGQYLEGFSCEDTLFIQGKVFKRNPSPILNSSEYNRFNLSTRYKRNLPNNGRDLHNNGGSVCKNSYASASLELDDRLGSSRLSPSVNSEGRCTPRLYCPSLLPPKYSSLQEVQGHIYFLAKDQHGCRFLQRKFDEGTPQDVQLIFNEIIHHVIELMMNPFGNYLMQKLLDVCNEEQRMQILCAVTRRPGELVNISLNAHGTRVVQKLVETLKTPQQISLVISSLEPGVIELIKDLNGNHVVQRCLQCLSSEDNKFLFDASAKYCVEIATHQHGCCVIQRCVDYSNGAHQQNLLAEVAANALVLAQDTYGNYVVQYVLHPDTPWVITNVICQLEGNFVHLSMQKFSSNVVEKCLKLAGEDKRMRIVQELLSTSRFEQLLQDPYANYVVQRALDVCKDSLHTLLVQAIQPHVPALRSSPYSKRILSRTLSKK